MYRRPDPNVRRVHQKPHAPIAYVPAHFTGVLCAPTTYPQPLRNMFHPVAQRNCNHLSYVLSHHYLGHHVRRVHPNARVTWYRCGATLPCRIGCIAIAQADSNACAFHPPDIITHVTRFAMLYVDPLHKPSTNATKADRLPRRQQTLGGCARTMTHTHVLHRTGHACMLHIALHVVLTKLLANVSMPGTMPGTMRPGRHPWSLRMPVTYELQYGNTHCCYARCPELILCTRNNGHQVT